MTDGQFSTLSLSHGQRKRLALLAACLEDRSFYVFDEWAADQDPHFKEIFYETLLLELKAKGKTIVVLSHDEKYYRVADRLIKLDYGQLVLTQDNAPRMPITPTETELPVLAEMFGLNHSTKTQIEALARRFDLQLVAYTRGPGGSLLYSEGEWSDQPGIPTDIKDTIGAGDSFTAALTVGCLRGFGLDEVNFLANEVASYVCSCSGAMPHCLPVYAKNFEGPQSPNSRKPARLPWRAPD